MPYLKVQDGRLQLAPELGLEVVVAHLLQVLSHEVQVPAHAHVKAQPQQVSCDVRCRAKPRI